MNRIVQKMKKISKIIFPCPISQKENSGWLERIRKYEISLKTSLQTQMLVLLVREKVMGLSCTNHKMH